MKKSIYLITVLVILLVSAVSVYAVPSNVMFSSTRKFLESLDKSDIKYSYMGVDNDNQEKVNVSYSYSGGSLKATIFFTEKNEECNIRIWNLIDFKAAYLESAYRICNEINSKYKLAKFYVDTSDNSITVSMDVIIREDYSAGDICKEALTRVVSICDDAYELLKDLE